MPRDWYERYRHILRDDPYGVKKVIRALRHLRDKATTGKNDIERELKYFRKNRNRMRWKIDGGQAVLTFRALIKSDRFDTAWEILMASITGSANDNQDATAAAIAA